MKLSTKQLRKIHAMGAQIEPGRYHGAKGDAITCQKCGAQSDSVEWFEAHKKIAHSDFDKEHHYKISARLYFWWHLKQLQKHHLLEYFWQGYFQYSCGESYIY